MNIKFEFTQEEAQYILNVLQAQPYNQVYKLIGKMMFQSQTNAQAQQPEETDAGSDNVPE